VKYGGFTMQIYYINIITFAFTFYIAMRIAKEVKKKAGINKKNTKELMNTEKVVLKQVWKAIRKPTSTDHKKNLFEAMEIIDKNYNSLFKYAISFSLIPLVMVFILQLILQQMILFEIGGFEVKWFTLLLLLIPIIVLKVIINWRKGKSTQ